jgi:hypothetical protein
VPVMAATPQSWMAQFQDTPIYELCIPGTHDSGTEGFPPGSPSRTQYYTITEQLAGGVRFLDMRLAYNAAEDNFHVVHSGDVISYLNFDTVVEWCNAFLAQNQSETILMSIKQEGSLPGGEDAFARGLTDWHDRHSAQGDWKSDLWYTDDAAVPTVKKAKSKIILLRRYAVTPPSTGQPPLFFGGLNLDPMNASFGGSFEVVSPPAPSPAKPNVIVGYEDHYKIGPDEKKQRVDGMLTHSMGAYTMPSPPNTLMWSFTFASTSSPGPLRAANAINPWLSARLTEIPGRLYGVLITDYAQRELWQQIYNVNFRSTPSPQPELTHSQ